MEGNAVISTQLEYFSIVYRKRNFAEAAKAIPMSTQGLTKAIRTLGRELGVTLFESDGSSNLQPTPYADKLYEMSLKWYRDQRQLEDGFSSIRNASRRVLRFGAAIGIPGYIGLSAFKEFESLHPEITVSCVEYPDYRADDGLLNGEYDLALTVAPYNDAFITTELHRSPITFWIPIDNPLGKKSFIGIDDLSNQDIGVVDSSFKVNEQIRTALDEKGIRPHSIVTTAEIFWLFQYALSGEGIGCGATHLEKIFKGSDRVHIATVSEIHWNFGISYMRNHRLTDDEHLLIDFITERVERIEANKDAEPLE